jgi:ubiquinone/menaquinone biosynthesis C-methylase UbiE
MERIDRKTMAGLIAAYGTDDTPRVYTHRNRLVGELFWKSHERMLALSKSSKRGRALDFGGGNGVLLRELSKRYDEVVCVDLNADIAREVVRLYKLPNVQVVSEDLFGLGLPDGHFDMIAAASVLEHILELDRLAAEMKRLLAPGGELLVAAPSENRLYELGRKLVGYSKPWDHHYDGEFIIETVGTKLMLTDKKFFPITWGPLAVFYLLRFEKAEK